MRETSFKSTVRHLTTLRRECLVVLAALILASASSSAQASVIGWSDETNQLMSFVDESNGLESYLHGLTTETYFNSSWGAAPHVRTNSNSRLTNDPFFPFDFFLGLIDLPHPVNFCGGSTSSTSSPGNGLSGGIWISGILSETVRPQAAILLGRLNPVEPVTKELLVVFEMLRPPQASAIV